MNFGELLRFALADENNKTVTNQRKNWITELSGFCSNWSCTYALSCGNSYRIGVFALCWRSNYIPQIGSDTGLRLNRIIDLGRQFRACLDLIWARWLFDKQTHKTTRLVCCNFTLDVWSACCKLSKWKLRCLLWAFLWVDLGVSLPQSHVHKNQVKLVKIFIYNVKFPRDASKSVFETKSSKNCPVKIEAAVI